MKNLILMIVLLLASSGCTVKTYHTTCTGADCPRSVVVRNSPPPVVVQAPAVQYRVVKYFDTRSSVWRYKRVACKSTRSSKTSVRRGVSLPPSSPRARPRRRARDSNALSRALGQKKRVKKKSKEKKKRVRTPPVGVVASL